MTGCGTPKVTAGGAPETVPETVQETEASNASDKANAHKAVTGTILHYSWGDEVYSWMTKGFSAGEKAYFRIRETAEVNGEVKTFYGLVDESGNVAIPVEYDMLMVGDGAVFGYQIQNNQFHNVVFNTKLAEVFSWDSERYRIHAVNDGVATFAEDAYSDRYIYHNLKAEPDDFIDPSDYFEDYNAGSVFNNGYAMCFAAKEAKGLRTSYFIDRYGKFKPFYFKPVYSSMRIPVMSKKYINGLIPLETDGWMLYEVPPIYAQALKLPGGHTQLGFYNINAGQILAFPDGYGEEYDWIAVPGSPANTDAFVVQGYALWSNLKPANPNVPEYRIFDINDVRMVTDESYSYVELTDLRRKSGHILVQRMDGKWGFISERFHPEEFYDDATNFYNGYALVCQDGGIYVINDRFEIVSEALPGDGCFMLQPTDTTVYAAVHDEAAGGYRVLGIESETIGASGGAFTLDSSLEERVGRYSLAKMTVAGRAVKPDVAAPQTDEAEADAPQTGDADSAAPQTDEAEVDSDLSEYSYIELIAEGTGKLVSDSQIIRIRWDADRFYAVDAEEAFLYSWKDGILEMNYESPEGMIHMEYVK